MAELTHQEDRALVKALLAGSEGAFRRFFDDQFPRLYRFVRSRGGSEDEAEELAQLTLCTVLEKLSTYRGEASLTTWLFSICRNRMTDAQRRLSRLVPEGSELESALESLDSDSGDPESRAQERDLAAIVQTVLDALPPRYSEVLRLKYEQDLSMKQIGARTGTSAKAVESLLTRARGAFKEAFHSFANSPLAEAQVHESR